MEVIGDVNIGCIDPEGNREFRREWVRRRRLGVRPASKTYERQGQRADQTPVVPPTDSRRFVAHRPRATIIGVARSGKAFGDRGTEPSRRRDA